MWEDHHRLFDLSQAKDRSQVPFLSHALSFYTAASREKMCFDYGDIRPETWSLRVFVCVTNTRSLLR